MLQAKCDVAVIGGGPAGLAAAVSAKRQGVDKVLIIERDTSLGGILQQCIHPGFGLSYYNEELTGPEYSQRFIAQAEELGVDALLNTMVLEVLPEGKIYCVNSQDGMTCIDAKSIVFAMGCRERTRANIMIPGTRPAGIYTAGAAQRLLNRQNEVVGEKMVILGSGDIGMIMARRMTLEGAEVVAVIELMDFLAGLTRNRVQCLDDFGIPLKLSHTITNIIGKERIEGVIVAQVDANKKPIKETEEFISCDTLLLSVGLIPENELTRDAGIEINSVTNGPAVNQYMQTSVPGIFAGGNVVHVNDLVDNVSTESAEAGRNAARYAMGILPPFSRKIGALAGKNIRYICPQNIELSKENMEIDLYFRVLAPETSVKITARSGKRVIAEKKVVRVNPGEIESIGFKISDIPENAADITVDVIKEAE